MRAVIDANVAVKWVVFEAGTEDALALLKSGGLIAPDLIVAECANILRKKAARAELTKDEAALAALVIQEAGFEIVPTRHLLAAAAKLAMSLDHPAYDCLYLALAQERGLSLVTADDRLIRKLEQGKSRALRTVAVSLHNAASALSGAKP